MKERIYTVTTGAFTRDIKPINDSDLAVNIESKEEKVFYTQKLKTTLIVSSKSQDFEWFMGFENNAILKCSTFKIHIVEKCGNVLRDVHKGMFSLNDCDFNLDNCTIKIKVEPDSIYNCIDKNKNIEVNILDIDNIITTSANLAYNYEYYVCSGVAAPAGINCIGPGANPSSWANFHTQFSLNWAYPGGVGGCNVDNINVTVKYREFAITSCVGGAPNPPPAGAGWFLETNNCGIDGTAKYVRYPIAGNVAGQNPNIAYGYLSFLTPCVGPPQAVHQAVNVTATPQTPNIIGYNKMQISSIFGTGSEWTFEVPCNPNSTYFWDDDGTGPMNFSVTAGQGTCKVRGKFTSGGFGFCNVRVTETHGNGYVSQKLFFTEFESGLGANNTVTDYISGPDKVCPNQNLIKYRIPDMPISTVPQVTVNGPFWSVSGGASIVAGLLTNEITVLAPASGTFNVNCNWTVTSTNGASFTITGSDVKPITISKIPQTQPIKGVFEIYPNEPGIIFSAVTRPGATYKWYNQLGNLLGSNSTLITTSNADFCLFLKEEVDCGCDFIKIADGTAFPGTPCIFWCPTESNEIVYDSNRLFHEACEYVLQGVGCSLDEIHSDFFEWNPIGDAPGYSVGVNYSTGLSNKLLHLTIAQKSDIIDPIASNVATKGLLTFDKLEKIWREAFNCYWYIDQVGRFRLEHISFFQSIVGYDTTISPNAVYNAAKRKYTYDKNKMPKVERFKWQEAFFTDFVGADIYYDSICVNQDSGSNISERGLEFVSTDLYYINLFPEDIIKTGFVLMANVYDGVNYAVAVELGEITNQPYANAHLSWANLHHNYHKHNRVLLEGYMNNSLTNFFSAKKTKLQKDIVLLLCCEDFEPQFKLVKTELGNGLVDSAEYTYKDHKLKLSLLHT